MFKKVKVFHNLPEQRSLSRHAVAWPVNLQLGPKLLFSALRNTLARCEQGAFEK
jgi:hypothetical protein